MLIARRPTTVNEPKWKLAFTAVTGWGRRECQTVPTTRAHRLYTSHNIIRYGRQNVFQYLSKTHILQRCKFAAYCMYTSSASEGWVNQLYEIYEEIDWWGESIWCERPAVHQECEDRFGHHIAIIPFVSLVLFCFLPYPDGNVIWFIPMSGFVSTVWKRNDCLSLWQDQQLFAFCASSFFYGELACRHADGMLKQNCTYGIVQKRNSDIIIESYHLRILFCFLFINNSTRLTGSPTNLST